ncbi:AraC family transcriptional regulator [Rhodopseudomonas palustris]|uniref:AraC family transcriptional regulator n=1 Tax=Rhodopseudomonas palustris TaxID=1076 RepID=A0A323URJ2_RHOPL|nr:helix-turn-helix domain-containing protein [Rhodopseudomonas palustris]PZA13776.1 AraC family transcriptional regulator [Rhodopseudomonas palustris]
MCSPDNRVFGDCLESETTWRAAVDREIDALGWTAATRIDQPDDDVTIYAIDAIAAQDAIIHPEGPATFSLSVFLDGRGTLSIDGAKPLSVEPGMAVLFTSSGPVRGENRFVAGQRFNVIDLRFEQRFLVKAGGAPLARIGGDLLTEHSRPDQRVTLAGWKAPPALLKTAREILDCKRAHDLSRNLFLYSKAVESLSIVVDTLSRPSGRKSVFKSNDRAKILQAQNLIGSSYHLDWTIAKLARHVGLNERKLKEGFRHVVGNSVHAYLREVRLEAAARLLLDGESVTQAALSVGFESLSHFSKIFAAAKGVSPSRYVR